MECEERFEDSIYPLDDDESWVDCIAGWACGIANQDGEDIEECCIKGQRI